MRIKAISALAFLSILCSSCGWAASSLRSQADIRGPSETHRAAAVALYVACFEDGKIQEWTGSGVIISRTEVVTAYHVAECSGQSNIFALTKDDDTFVMVLAESVLGADLAKLKLEDPNKGLLPLLPKKIQLGKLPKEGDSICLEVARPIRARKCGGVLAIRDNPGRDVVHDAHTIPGNSGGGVYDMDGSLVGVVSQYIRCRTPDGMTRVCGGVVSSVWRYRRDLKLSMQTHR